MALRNLDLVFRNVLRNRRRTLLTILSIAASLCLFGVLAAMYRMFFHTAPAPDKALRLVTRNRISITTIMPISYREKIRSVPGVREVTVLQWFGGVYKDARDPRNMFPRFSVDAATLFDVYAEYRIPEEQRKAFVRERASCVVGRELAERFRWKLGDHIVLKGDIFPVTLDLTIRGIYDHPLDSDGLFFHHDYLLEALPWGRRANFAGLLVSRVDSPDSAPRVARAVDAMFRNSPYETRTESEQQFELSFLSYLGNVKLFLLAISTALVFTILLVAANTMAMAVRERVREVGIMKTLGYRPADVLGILLGESVAMALTGAALGLLLAGGICAALRQAPVPFVNLRALEVSPAVLGASLVVAAVVGLASCVAPAWTASRRPIVDSLRFTD